MKSNNKLIAIIIVVVVIIVIIAVILSAGTFSPKFPDDETEKRKKQEEEERIKKLEKEKQLNALKEELEKLNKRKSELEIQFEKIIKQEKKVLFVARLLIGVGLVVTDYFYYRYYNTNFVFDKVISDLLKLNSALVAGYSFVAFITHGTPAKFATYLKSILKRVLRWFHKSTYTEYDGVLVNISLTEQIIAALQEPIKVDTEKQTVINP